MVGDVKQGIALLYGNGHPLARHVARGDALRGQRQPEAHRGGRESEGHRHAVGREHGGQRGPLRDLGFRSVRRGDDRHIHRFRQLDARQLHADRRHGAARQHHARRGRSRRYRLRPVRHVAVRAAGGIHRRPHGRANAGVPREEDSRARDETRRAVHPARADRSARIHRHLDGDDVGVELAAQHRSARPDRDDVRVHVDGEQQRFGVRGPQRQHRLVQHHRCASQCSSAGSC